jgi:hypothetical protein
LLNTGKRIQRTMGRKHRRGKKAISAPAAPEPTSSRFQFFLWISSFFFFAALIMRLDVITAWPGAESYALDHALSLERGNSLLSLLYHGLFPIGEGIDTSTEAVWLFPRLLSSVSLLLTGFFTYRFGGKLFGKDAMTYGLLCAGASLFLPFFGKVATGDALALLGQAGFFWTILLAGVDTEKNRLLPASLFILVAAIAAPASSLLFALATILTGRLVLGGNKQWFNLLALLGIPLIVLLLQGNQGIRTYWFWGYHPLGYGKWLLYSLLGMLPLLGWMLAGFRDLIYKVGKEEQAGRIFAAGLVISFAAQSLVFPLLIAVLAGKQMQLYFREANYPWRDWVRGGAVVHLIIAFLGAFLALAGIGVAFPGAGFRAALGMAAAYWIFSLFGVIGLYGERRDFALGGSVLAGMLGMLFFWVQVYPYFEAERGWARRLVERSEVALPIFIPEGDAASSALPYYRKAGFPITQDSSKADLFLDHWPLTDTVSTAPIEIKGRILLEQREFGIRPK